MATLLVPSQFSTVQAAINAAVAGDVIKCQANHLFTEWITLKNKGVLADYITITTDANLANLPASGFRTNPSYAAFMPRFQSPGSGSPTIVTEAGANHYKLQHIEFPEVPSGFNSIIQLAINDSTQQFRSQEPTDIIVDQCWIHGGKICGQKVGINTNGIRITISNNHFSDCFGLSVVQDTQAIAGGNGHGPLTVINNYISGGTEPFLLGGSDPRIRTLMTVTGAASATSAAVTCSEASHTLSELVPNQDLSVKVAGVDKFTTLRTITGTGVSGTITFDNVGGIPDSPGAVRAGCVLGMDGPGTGLIFQRNLVSNDTAWRLGALAAVTGTPTATAQTGVGTLPAGIEFYTIQAVSTGGNQGTTVTSAQSVETFATLASPGRITVSWNAGITGVTSYKVWRGTTTGVKTQFLTTTNTSIVDDGTLIWTAGTPAAASAVRIKNLFEIKALQNGQIDSNIFENVWRSANDNPIGYAWWIKSVNQEGTGTYIQSRDIVLENNWIRHCYGFYLIHGVEIPGASGFGYPGPTKNITIRNNLVSDSGGAPWNSGNNGSYAFQATENIVNLTMDHNTVDHTTNGSSGGLMVVDSASTKLTGLAITNNMLRRETFGIHDSTGEGTVALNNSTIGGYSFLNNAIATAPLGSYPATTQSESLALWEAEFVTYGTDYHLKTGSTYKNDGTDGKDLGADIDIINAALVGVDNGTPIFQGVVSTILHNGIYPPTSTVTSISIPATSWAGAFIELVPVPSGIIIFASSEA